MGLHVTNVKLRWLKRILVIALMLLLILVLGISMAWFWLNHVLRSSLPRLSGSLVVTGPHAEIRIERDALGVPTIRAAHRDDLAFGLGFVHAQDRFFQMDAIRRSAAGELAEMVGPGTNDRILARDRSVRIMRFRRVAQQVVANLEEPERRWLDAYVEGVNTGLSALGGKPFEYLLLGASPAPWKPEDSVLAVLAMYLDLQGKDHERESALGVIRDVLPGPLAEFLCPKGSAEWDAPIQGGPLPPPPIPAADVFDLRREPAHLLRDVPADSTPLEDLETLFEGSNNWAVSGERSRTGGAIIANDMHLRLGVPTTWYRAALVFPERENERGEGGESGPRQATGATLPGGPAMVVGSNGMIAWGLTNSAGDWSDLIELDVDPADSDTYLTPEGKRSFEHHRETIKIKGRADEVLDIRSTIWGPVIGVDHKNRPRALRWVALDPQGSNLNLVGMAAARTMEEALELAPSCGVPHQNFVVGDIQGRIGWTILGRIPRRVGQGDSRFPLRGRDQGGHWGGFYPSREAPRIIKPPDGLLWTANARVVDGPMLAQIGFGDYDRGCRAGMIRDGLRALDQATEADMLSIQLDDRAVFLERWRNLLLDLLRPEVVSHDRRRLELKTLLENWSGRASVDSADYRLVWEIRLRIVRAALSPLTARCRQADPRFRLAGLECEAPLWALVTKRPAHLLDPIYHDWDSLLLAMVDATLAEATRSGQPLASRTWGEKNVVRIEHPMSLASPLLGRLLSLNMPTEPLPGGRKDMPRVQGRTFGASQRMAVTPGRESSGYFHMPCGQSGHPLSPHYRDGHEAWVRGTPTPFLPGPVVHTLTLKTVQSNLLEPGAHVD
jgi:penicillin amidase